MKTTISWNRKVLFLLAVGLLLPVITQAQDFPEGKGRDRILTACTACHGLDNIANPHQKLTAEEWDVYVYDMVARGAAVHKDELEDVKQYLIKNFAVDKK